MQIWQLLHARRIVSSFIVDNIQTGWISQEDSGLVFPNVNLVAWGYGRVVSTRLLPVVYFFMLY